MKLTVLGSGSSVPHPERTSSAYWVECSGGTLLLDCSASAVHRMAAEGCEWADLDAVWISHFHLDHCGGLAPFLFGTKYAPETQGRKKPLRIFGPKGLGDLMNAFDAAYDYGLLEQPFPVTLEEIADGSSFSVFPGLEALTFSTPHTPESCAIRLVASDGGSMVFTSDTGYSTNLAVFARGVDLLLIECSFVKDKPVEKHLDLSDIANIARFAKPGMIALTHLYPEWDDIAIEGAIAELTECKLLKAFDGMRLSLPPNDKNRWPDTVYP